MFLISRLKFLSLHERNILYNEQKSIISKQY